MARLVVISGSQKGREFELEASQTIGRLAANEIPVSDSRMSRRNSRIVLQGAAWFLEDLESKNGTFLNGSPVDRARLTDNDEIRVGETYFSFLADAGVAVGEAGLEAPAPARPRAVSPRDIAPADVGPARDRALAYSRFAGEGATKTSFSWLRQDLSQRDGGFRILVVLGVILIMAGVFWLIQMLVAGG